MGRLSGKIAVVTGGAGGIGKETAKLFLKEGAKVVLVDLIETMLDDTLQELAEHGDVIAVQADVSKEADVIKYVETAVKQYGTIDVFFNNAGIEGKVAPLIEQTVEDFDKVMAVNVRGVFLGLKHVLPIMIKQKSGSIINTSSMVGIRGGTDIAPYVTSKSAVIGLTKAAAAEVAAMNVRVNSIHPAPVNTRLIRALEEGHCPGDSESYKEKLLSAIPLGRYAEPIEIAKLVLFLASDDSSYITGSQYQIDGGIGAK